MGLLFKCEHGFDEDLRTLELFGRVNAGHDLFCQWVVCELILVLRRTGLLRCQGRDI
jgi:hypothetical protein